MSRKYNFVLPWNYTGKNLNPYILARNNLKKQLESKYNLTLILEDWFCPLKIILRSDEPEAEVLLFIYNTLQDNGLAQWFLLSPRLETRKRKRDEN